MGRDRFTRKLPGWMATALLALATTMWTFWGVGEMYYEGWWGAWTNRLPYLVPPTLCVVFTLVALTWPRIGGWIVLLVGGAFTAWRWVRQAQLGLLTPLWALSWFPISGVFVVVGALFLLEGRYRRQRRAAGQELPQRWLHYVIALGPPLLTALGVTAFFVPLLLSRYDDGDRSARRIEGKGVTLVWAPAGPGWNGHPLRGVGRYPSWDDLALYGEPPVGIHLQRKLEEGRHGTAADMRATGLCRYLSADGTALMLEPQDIWRMPTTDEVVRSLVRRGESAGCTWDGVSTRADCERQPSKDTPLWAPDEAPIYYWTGDEYDGGEAWYVPYTGGGLYGGMIDHQLKRWGNARHGFRCVKTPQDLERSTGTCPRKREQGVRVQCEVRLTLGPGVLGLVGPNGAGKTTLATGATSRGIPFPATDGGTWHGTVPVRNCRLLGARLVPSQADEAKNKVDSGYS